MSWLALCYLHPQLDCAKELQVAAAEAELFVQQHIPHLLSELQAQTLALIAEVESSKLPLMEQGSDAALTAINEVCRHACTWDTHCIACSA